jgi:hypothetical protein
MATIRTTCSLWATSMWHPRSPSGKSPTASVVMVSFEGRAAAPLKLPSRKGGTVAIIRAGREQNPTGSVVTDGIRRPLEPGFVIGRG